MPRYVIFVEHASKVWTACFTEYTLFAYKNADQNKFKIKQDTCKNKQQHKKKTNKQTNKQNKTKQTMKQKTNIH